MVHDTISEIVLKKYNETVIQYEYKILKIMRY